MKHLAIYGVCGGILIVAMRYVEYRFLVVEHSVEIYAALIAASFAAVGIWFGLTLTGRKVVVKEVTVEVQVPASADPFVPNAAKIAALGMTPRELEVLQLIADGLSNKEMAARLFVSETPSRPTPAGSSTNSAPAAARRRCSSRRARASSPEWVISGQESQNHPKA